MSGQWEIAGKKREKPNQKVGPQAPKKKVENVTVNVEDVLAKSQVKLLYYNGKNKENSPVEIKKNLELGSKKNQKKQEKPVEAPKPKVARSIEAALQQIDVNELKKLFESNKSRFPDAPIVWLKDLAYFLNQKINVEPQDPVFSQKPIKFPLTAVSPNIKSVIDQAIQEANVNNVQVFFDISLVSLATDMAKNLPVMGHKLFLQYIALSEPGLVTTNLTKHSSLRSSYQNQPNIGLSILWAIGQAGFTNFDVGLKIFQEFMLPLIELKNYSRFIVKYLLDIVSCNEQTSISRDQFLFILEVIFSNRKNFPNDLKQILIDLLPKLKSNISASKEEASKNSIEIYLKNIASNGNLVYQECLCDVIIEDFKKDPSSLDHWRKVFTKNTASNIIFLQYVDNNWQTVSEKLNKKRFAEVMNQIITTSNEHVKKIKKDDGSKTAIQLAEKLVNKMSEKKSSRSVTKFLFILLCLLGAVIYYDIRQEGSWQNSNTNKILKKSGVCEFSHLVIVKIQEGVQVVDQQIEANFPDFHKTVAESSKPYLELFSNLNRVFRNIYFRILEATQEHLPNVMEAVESYAPGFLEQSQNVVSSAWSSSLFYFNRSMDYLRKQVFVGQLSPDNVGKLVFEALNTTQRQAVEYSNWIYEKIQNAIK